MNGWMDGFCKFMSASRSTVLVNTFPTIPRSLIYDDMGVLSISLKILVNSLENWVGMFVCMFHMYESIEYRSSA